MSFTELKSTTKLCVTLRSALRWEVESTTTLLCVTLRSALRWEVEFDPRRLEGIWWNNNIGAEDYKKNNYKLSFTELKSTTKSCVTLRSALRWEVESTTILLCVTLRSALRWEVEFDPRRLEGIWWNENIGAEDYKKNNYELSFTELKSTTKLCVTLRSALRWEVESTTTLLCVTLRSALRWEVEFDPRRLEGIWWNNNIGAEDYKKNNYKLSFTELKSTTKLWRCGPHYLRSFWCPGKQKL